MHRRQIVENPFCFAGYLELRYAIGVVEDLDVRPGYLAAPAGFEGFPTSDNESALIVASLAAKRPA